MANLNPDLKTISLATFRKDGREVRTPVWFVHTPEGKLWVGTGVTSWKLKRIRNNPQVRWAPCDSSGRRIQGDWQDGTARIIDDVWTSGRMERLRKVKYGWTWKLILTLYVLSGKLDTQAVVELTPDGT